jgi:enoyl-CoA hydratase
LIGSVYHEAAYQEDPMPDTEPLVIEHRGRFAPLSFYRPHALNAFDRPLVEATTKAMAELSADEDVLSIVVRGEARSRGNVRRSP